MLSPNLIQLITFCYCVSSYKIIVHGSQASRILCVTPERSNRSYYYDPKLQNVTECNTLAYYMKNHFMYFKSYETYIFQHGYHTPLDDYYFEIKNVKHLTLTGPDLTEHNNRAIIDCNECPSALSSISCQTSSSPISPSLLVLANTAPANGAVCTTLRLVH